MIVFHVVLAGLTHVARLVVVIWPLFWPATASAQSLSGYVGGAFTIAPWNPQPISGGSPSTTYENTSTDSIVSGLSVEAGWFFTPSTAIGVEIGTPFGRSNLTQRFDYALGGPYVLEARYRERTIFVVINHQITGTRAHLELVGGGVVRANSLTA